MDNPFEQPSPKPGNRSDTLEAGPWRQVASRLAVRLHPAPSKHSFDFDALSKDLAAGLSRREALRRLGLVLGGTLLAALGLAPPAQAVHCPAGQLDCFGVCVNPLTDPKNCGRCGAACNNTHLCCSGVCKNPSNDRANCGACGTVCPAGWFCCSGQCVNPKTDPNHCGACLQKCLPGQSCINGMCLCPAGQVLCYGRCTDRSIDENNCGGCGLRCAATQACLNGQCRPCPSINLCPGTQGRACCSSTHPTCCNGVCCAAGQFCCNNQCSVCPCHQTTCTGSQGTNCCEPGLNCADGICCIPPGSTQECDLGGVCCPGSSCVPHPEDPTISRCRKPSGSTCQSGNECERGICTNNVCCIPAGAIDTCGSDNDCCAGSTCINGRCLKATGSVCQQAFECFVERCTNNICCIAPGEPFECRFNQGCCPGSFCQEDPAQAISRCRVPSGGACQSNNQCERGFCTSGVCCIPAGTGPVGCGSDGDCCAGSTCINGICAKPSGSTCQSGLECHNTFCISGVCCIPAGGSAFVSCRSDADCCAGLTCYDPGGLGVCLAPRGASCTADFQCITFACVNSVCCIPEDQAGCTSNGDCCAGLTCDPTNVCRAPVIGT